MKSPVDSTAYFGSAGESKLIKVLPNELMFVCVTSASKHAWTMIVSGLHSSGPVLCFELFWHTISHPQNIATLALFGHLSLLSLFDV